MAAVGACSNNFSDQQLQTVSSATVNAELDLIVRNTGQHLCFATLVAPNVAVTAAHCVDNWPPGRLKVRGVSGIEAALDRITEDTHYNQSRDLTFDIAVIYLAHDVPDHPIDISDTEPTSLEDQPGIVGVPGGTATITIEAFADCKSEYARTPIIISDESDLCAVGDGGKVCQGDSGAPLVTVEQFGSDPTRLRPVLTGVVSRGIDCTGGTSGVYTATGRSQIAGFLRYALRR